MAQPCSYISQSAGALGSQIFWSTFAGCSSALICHSYAVPALLNLTTSAVVVPLTFAAFSISNFPLSGDFVTQPLYCRVYAIGFLAIATIFQTPLPFLGFPAGVIYWLVPKILMLKIGMDLFSCLEGLEFRIKRTNP